MFASALCLVHCLALPWIIAIAGSYFGSMFESPAFHDVMLVVAIAIGLPVFIISYIKYKSKLILAAGIVGLSLTTYGTVKSEPCCPPATEVAVACEDSECDSEGDCSAEKVAVACEDSACDSEGDCSAQEVAVACEDSECDSEGDCSAEESSTSDSPEVVKASSFNTVPLGVSLLILAHFLNFRKRSTCKKDCCQ